MVLQFLGNIGVFCGALEEHVLEQVSHPGFAVTLVPGTNKHGQINRDRRTRLVGDQQDADPVLELELGNPLDGRHQLRLGPGRLGAKDQAQC